MIIMTHFFEVTDKLCSKSYKTAKAGKFMITVAYDFLIHKDGRFLC